MATTSDTTLGRALADELLRRHDVWRRDSEAVQLAYEGWLNSSGKGRDVAYAGYLAALDQEELAAGEYRAELIWADRISG